MYAIKGRSWRSISSHADLQEGETLSIDFPVELTIPTETERNESIRIGIGQWMNSVVQVNGYDDIVSCASYANSPTPKFKAEALAAIAWRDAVWASAYALLADPPEGVDSLEKVIALMPKATQYGWLADPVPTRGSQGESGPVIGST